MLFNVNMYTDAWPSKGCLQLWGTAAISCIAVLRPDVPSTANRVGDCPDLMRKWMDAQVQDHRLAAGLWHRMHIGIPKRKGDSSSLGCTCRLLQLLPAWGPQVYLVLLAFRAAAGL